MDKQWMRGMEVQAMNRSVLTIALSNSDAAYLQQLLFDQDQAHQQQQQQTSQIQVLMRSALSIRALEHRSLGQITYAQALKILCTQLKGQAELTMALGWAQILQPCPVSFKITVQVLAKLKIVTEPQCFAWHPFSVSS